MPMIVFVFVFVRMRLDVVGDGIQSFRFQFWHGSSLPFQFRLPAFQIFPTLFDFL